MKTPSRRARFAAAVAAVTALGIVAGPAGSRSTVDRDLPGDSSVPFWPYETGALLGTSETFIDVRDDGSYFDPSIARRVLPVSANTTNADGRQRAHGSRSAVRG